MHSGQPEKIGDFVKKIRAEKNLSVEDVSNKSGGEISGSYVNKIENEEVNITIPKLIALSKGLGVPALELFAVVSGIKLDPKAIAATRFFQIAEGYAGLSKQERESVEPLLTAIEMTISRSFSERKENEPKSKIPVMTLEEAKADNDKKTDPDKKGKKK